MKDVLDRRQLLSRTARSAVALVAGGSLAGVLTPTAPAAAIPDADLAYARLLVGVELLAVDFYTQAIASRQFAAPATAFMRRARFNEQEHVAACSQILTGAGQVAASSADFDFSYPATSFASRGAIARLGVELETLALGAYLGAVDALQTNALKQPAARIAANEAEHLSAFASLVDGRPTGSSFPDPLTIDEASNALDAYAS
jgi:rubrerythrin